MGAILPYGLFCTLVVVGVIVAIVAGHPTTVVAALGIWALAGGAIAAILYRFLKRRR